MNPTAERLMSALSTTDEVMVCTKNNEFCVIRADRHRPEGCIEYYFVQGPIHGLGGNDPQTICEQIAYIDQMLARNPDLRIATPDEIANANPHLEIVSLN